jgi:predicted O-methyltransferase YrrM
VLDDRVRAVLARLEEEDRAEGEAGLPPAQRSLAVGPDSGRLLFGLVAPNAGCEVLEIGGSRGYSAIWLAAAARILGGRVVTLEQDPRKIEAWRANVEAAGLSDWCQLIEGDARETMPAIPDVFDLVFIDAEKDDYDFYFRTALTKVEPGALIVADNVISHREQLHGYSEARQADPDLVSVTVPLEQGLELTSVLRTVR